MPPKTVDDLADMDPRHTAGLRPMRSGGGSGYAKTTSTLARLSADFADVLTGTGHGELLTRSALDIKTRELLNVATLAARGDNSTAFRFHCGEMLNAGWTPLQIVDTIKLAGAYTSFSASSANLAHLDEVFASRGVEMPENARRQPRPLPEGSDTRKPETVPVTAQLLDKRMGHIASLAILIALASEEGAVSREVPACLRNGWTLEQIVEVLIHLTGYMGWPTVLASAADVLDALNCADDQDAATGIDSGSRA
jgi:4-carboxymuconolactone decarboxylase